jgi:hypothetical protein
MTLSLLDEKPSFEGGSLPSVIAADSPHPIGTDYSGVADHALVLEPFADDVHA